MSDPQDLAEALGVPVDAELLRLALVHRSYAYEAGGVPDNERLEFLGDAVLGLVVARMLYERYPDVAEGELAKLRSAVVNATALAEVGRTLDLGAHLSLGRGEEVTGGRDKSSILADAVEAVIAAVFLSSGIGAATDLVHRLLDPLVAAAVETGAGLDWKTSLQEIVAAQSLGVPEYRVSDVGPDHAKEFFAEVLVDGEVRGTGAGRSKKAAEQEAAQRAYAAVADETADAAIAPPDA
jgi:ribonuclease-3